MNKDAYNKNSYENEVIIPKRAIAAISKNSILKHARDFRQRIRTRRAEANKKAVVGILLTVMGIAVFFGKGKGKDVINDPQIYTQEALDGITKKPISYNNLEYIPQSNVKYSQNELDARKYVELIDSGVDVEYVLSDFAWGLDWEPRISTDLIIENGTTFYGSLKNYARFESREDLASQIHEESFLEHLVTVYASPDDANYSDLLRAAQKYYNFRNDDPYSHLSNNEEEMLENLVKKCIRSHDVLYEKCKVILEDLKRKNDPSYIDDWSNAK